VSGVFINLPMAISVMKQDLKDSTMRNKLSKVAKNASFDDLWLLEFFQK
jgi:hypothetical protein